jgi:hypothetical protein
MTLEGALIQRNAMMESVVLQWDAAMKGVILHWNAMMEGVTYINKYFDCFVRGEVVSNLGFEF